MRCTYNDSWEYLSSNRQRSDTSVVVIDFRAQQNNMSILYIQRDQQTDKQM